MAEMGSNTRVVEKKALQSVCRSFLEWLEDYPRYGVVYRVTIDAKTLANRYEFPLVDIHGHTSNGSHRFFSMGRIPAEDTEGFSWFVRQLAACLGVSS